MKNLGKLLALLGVFLLIVYLPMGLTFIIIGLILFALGKDTTKTVEAEIRKEQERPCPFCKEPVLKSAVKCKHCQSEIPPVIEDLPLNELIKVEKGLWECSRCHTKMLLAGEFCSKCRGSKRAIAVRK